MKEQTSSSPEYRAVAVAATTASSPSSAVVSSSTSSASAYLGSFCSGTGDGAGNGVNSAIVQVLHQTSKRRTWNECEVEEIEEEVDEEDDDDDDDNNKHLQIKGCPEEHLVVTGDQSMLISSGEESPLGNNRASDKFELRSSSTSSEQQHDYASRQSSGESVVSDSLVQSPHPNASQSQPSYQVHSQQHQHSQRVQLKRKSYSSMMSSKVMQRTISSSSSNSYFGTVDEESDDEDTATAKMNSSSVDSEERTEHEVREERHEEEIQDMRSKQQTARRAYARSISFSGVRSYAHGAVGGGGGRYLQQQQANLAARRGLIFHRLDGRQLLPSISCE